MEFPQRHDCSKGGARPRRRVQHRHQTGIRNTALGVGDGGVGCAGGGARWGAQRSRGASSEIGPALTDSPIVRKLTFTGSTEVGRRLEQACAATLKRTSMELGGNAPFIVFEDAEIDAAVAGALISKYRNSGQTCVCTNRILVHESIHDVFVEKLVAATRELKLGDGREEGVQQGPLVNEGAVQDVERLVEQSTAAGAVVALGGQRADLGPCYYQPTVLTGVTPDMAVFRNEIFGPVAPVTTFRDEADAVALANDTEFGLASYFYTRDIGGSGASQRRWIMGWWVSTRASFPMKWRRLVASKPQVPVERGPSTVSMTTSRSSTSSWGDSTDSCITACQGATKAASAAYPSDLSEKETIWIPESFVRRWANLQRACAWSQ